MCSGSTYYTMSCHVYRYVPEQALVFGKISLAFS